MKVAQAPRLCTGLAPTRVLIWYSVPMSGSPNHGRRNRAFLISAAVFVVLAIVPISLGVFYRTTDADLTAQVTNQQQTVATITATAIRLKLDRLVSIAAAMASSTQLTSFVTHNQWNEAANVTRDLQNNTLFYDTYIDRIVLWDKFGIEQSAYPTLSSGIGSSATSSAWYQAISSGAPSYVSFVTQRTAVPRINVINIAAPIMKDGVLVGILVMQVPTTNFLEFGESASLGPYGFIYIVDSKGNAVTDPKLPSNNGVINLASLPVVKTILVDGQGVSLFPDESGSLSVIGYRVVSGYNWEVVTQEPYAEALATRDSLLWLIMWEIIAASLVDLLIAYLVFFFLVAKNEDIKSANLT
jgi:hypothetical protein